MHNCNNNLHDQIKLLSFAKSLVVCEICNSGDSFQLVLPSLLFFLASSSGVYWNATGYFYSSVCCKTRRI